MTPAPALGGGANRPGGRIQIDLEIRRRFCSALRGRRAVSPVDYHDTFASVVSLLLVFWVADTCAIIDIHVLGAETSTYLKHHPLRLFWLVSLALLLAYGLAAVAARLVNRGNESTIRPGGTAWHFAFSENRPAGHVVAASVELRDGRIIQGVLAGTTTDAEDNREVCLVKPMAVRRGAADQPVRLTDEFVVIRESDVMAVSGRYLPAASPDTSVPRLELRWPITRGRAAC
jgi:Family of unknown function (DUF6338)